MTLSRPQTDPEIFRLNRRWNIRFSDTQILVATQAKSFRLSTSKDDIQSQKSSKPKMGERVWWKYLFRFHMTPHYLFLRPLWGYWKIFPGRDKQLRWKRHTKKRFVMVAVLDVNLLWVHRIWIVHLV